MSQVEQIYFEGYEAFEQGDFNKAIELAETCLAISSPDSYWFAGALGLKCWAANFARNLSAVEEYAKILLLLDSGEDKPWFDGLAWFNLGLVSAQQGRLGEARSYFLRAADSYQSQELHARQSVDWQVVLEYFATLARWSASGETDELGDFLSRFDEDKRSRSELLDHLLVAARITLRFSEGEEVKREAIEGVRAGVSRTFLSPVLLYCVGDV